MPDQGKKLRPGPFCVYQCAYRRGDSSVDSLITADVQRLCEKTLTIDELSVLSARSDLHAHVDEPLKYYNVLKLFQAGRMAAVRKIAADFLKKYPHSRQASSVRDMLDKSNNAQKGVLSIGVLAPLSGSVADVGKQVVQGIQLAVDRMSASSDMKIKLVICDTRANMLETAAGTRSW